GGDTSAGGGAGAAGGASVAWFCVTAGGTVGGGSGMVMGCSGGGPRRSLWLAEAILSPDLFALSWAVCAGVILLGPTSRVMIRVWAEVNTARCPNAPAVPMTASPTRAAAVIVQLRRGGGASL